MTIVIQRLVSWTTALASLAFVLGCATTVSYTPMDYCTQPINPLMARVVFLRSVSIFGAAAAIGISDNDQPIGNVGTGSKLCWDRYPGKARIIGRNVFDGRTAPNWRIEIDTKANDVYYVRGSIIGTWELSANPD